METEKMKLDHNSKLLLIVCITMVVLAAILAWHNITITRLRRGFRFFPYMLIDLDMIFSESLQSFLSKPQNDAGERFSSNYGESRSRDSNNQWTFTPRNGDQIRLRRPNDQNQATTQRNNDTQRQVIETSNRKQLSARNDSFFEFSLTQKLIYVFTCLLSLTVWSALIVSISSFVLLYLIDAFPDSILIKNAYFALHSYVAYFTKILRYQ